MSYTHFELVKNNSFILRNVNCNAQLIFWKNFRILNESKINLVDPDFYRSPFRYVQFLYINYIKRKKKSIPGVTVWIVDVWSINFYHWLVEALPKVLSTRLDLTTVTVVLPYQYKRLGFHEEMLKLLKIPFEYFDEHKDRLVLQQVYVPLNVSSCQTSNPVYIRKLRGIFLSLLTSSRGNTRRIYISRQLAKQRKIVNEPELSIVLQQYGFEVISFEGLSFLDQVKLASEATILVGLHGAGLTNMIFMEPGSVVVELSRKDDDNLCYQYLAYSARLQYESLPCDNTTSDLHFSDFIVDCKSMSDLLEKFNAPVSLIAKR